VDRELWEDAVAEAVAELLDPHQMGTFLGGVSLDSPEGRAQLAEAVRMVAGRSRKKSGFAPTGRGQNPFWQQGPTHKKWW